MPALEAFATGRLGNEGAIFFLAGGRGMLSLLQSRGYAGFGVVSLRKWLWAVAAIFEIVQFGVESSRG